MVERHGPLSLSRQCRLLGLSRAALYYRPVEVGAYQPELMALIDRQYLRAPFYGSRRMAAWLGEQGHMVNRKRVQRLMQLMGLEAIYQRPRTSRPAPQHRVYPYLLRGLKIERVNQVWAADICYIPMARGFLYLVAVVDWVSRYVLAWRLSNLLDASFCVEALEEALGLGRPEIFNTDQGSQFTAQDFTGMLGARGIAISMDGRGRFSDNIFVERLWRSLKYEEVYLRAYESVAEARAGIAAYFEFYNHERLHQALGYRTPRKVFEETIPLAGSLPPSKPRSSAIARTAWPAQPQLAGAVQRAPASDAKPDSFSAALRG
jgi:putative transposase